MRVTVTAADVFNEYGQRQPINTIINVSDAYGFALIRALKATDTDGVLISTLPQSPFNPTPTLYLGVLAWATRPLTNIPTGATARFTGIGRNVELWTWDGTRWVAPGVIVLAQASVPVPLTGTTVAQILTSVTVPGGCMGPNGSIRVTLLGSMTNNANNKTWIIRYGGAATAYYLAGISSAGGLAARVRIANRGATGSQVGPPNSVSAEIGVFAAPQISSENSEVDQTVQVVGQLAVGTDTMTVESYLVELIP